MHPADQNDATFITDRGFYCWDLLPFVLKNTWATYQRLVNQMFANHIGKIPQVYVDDHAR